MSHSLQSPIAILSDIHGNLEALEAVLEALEADGIKHLIHLGDLVGYNANPRECLEILRRRKALSILGNHDLGVVDPRSSEGFNVLAHEALLYSQEQLSPEDRRYLENLPRTEIIEERFLFCHGTPENIDSYILNVFQAKRVFNLIRRRHPAVRICFHGHTHIQRLWVRDQRGKVSASSAVYSSVILDDQVTYLINPGSVGQPRQQDNRARYLLFDPHRGIIKFKAVPYDIKKAQKKILDARLPEYLALRLQEGV
ncbi:metallophosphoesterase family protein [Desulforhabdus amnigena]|jgi:predicted phosphodiesterase|uniref:Metallophosphatase family protein n=1 Tax=Desulforhabdus amnigena TaxID=40218 RepID=A0A9W6FWU8_9BACT|nr:metallophosphoesterase family protein [Desulforhabdus amnigena]GLI36485.1 metallophosphatase family protein [Desulforhabdus amnigena]